MVVDKYVTILNVYFALSITLSVCLARTARVPAQFTFRSVRDSALPAIQPIIAAGSNGCSSFKSFFGLTYDQMQAKNTTYHENITIDLITKSGPVKYLLTDTERLKTLVHTNDKTIVLIHGFGESSEGEMVQALSSELINQNGLKVFALDGRHTIKLEYLRSSTYSRFMGELLGKSLSHLIQGGYDPSNIYLIGHSLGSHIAGSAGKQVYHLTGKLIGRITGLDPAGPCFHNVTREERLDRSDAVYVDVIHTNAGILGIDTPLGHKDFFPNGGTTQPGCMFYICDHSRAWELYAQSIRNPKVFPARKCSSLQNFYEGRCNKTDVCFMGVECEGGKDGSYYLDTGASTPFGLGILK